MTLLDAMAAGLLPALSGPEWLAWRTFLAAVFGLPIDADGLDTFRACTGRDVVPERQAREAWLVVGRRGGKSRIAALLAVWLATRDYTGRLAPGERGTLPVVAADRRQARVVMGYVTGLLDSGPLRRLVVKRTAESIELSTRVRIEIHTASWRSLRGYTVVGAVLDEVAFWRSDDSANPDHEIVAALRPAMATVPDALLVGISSPYARRGVLWDAYRRHFGKPGDVLVWKAPSRAMNPNVPEALVAEALAADEASARAEYLAEFRQDVEAFLSRDVLDAVTVPGRTVLPPVDGVSYTAFVDPSGGSQDAFTLAIAHREADGLVVLDHVSERRPPFSPAAVVAEFADVLRAYRCTRVVGDRYGGEWPRERFAEAGVHYEPSERTKSEIYTAALPILTSGRAALLDVPRLQAQLLGLERRTARGGRDSVDHGPHGSDDLANSALGAVVLANVETAGAIVGSVLPRRRPHRVRDALDMDCPRTLVADGFRGGRAAW